MSIPTTVEQLKNKVDQDITSKTARKSITPTILGELLKVIIDFIVNLIGTGSGSSTDTNIKRFPKDASLTSAHIGLLAMQQVTLLNDPPTSSEDIVTKAVLCTTEPMVPGVKGVYKLTFSGIRKLQPVTKLIKVDMSANPSAGDTIVFSVNTLSDETLTFVSSGSGNASNNEVEVGATLADTLTNIVSHFTSAGTNLTNNRARVNDTDNATYIEFELSHNEADAVKYIQDSTITTTGSGVYSISTTRELSSYAQELLDISTDNNSMLNATTWDSSNNVREILLYSQLYVASNGQPNGTTGAFGLKYFADDTEAIAAINWALSNNAYFPTMFDITSALTLNAGNYEMQISNKTAPLNTMVSTISPQNNHNITVSSTTTTTPVLPVVEQVKNFILGRIEGVDGEEVLINTSFIFDLKLSSEDDGASGAVIPQIYKSYIPHLIAWRNGTVIDLYGFGTNILLTSGIYYNDNFLVNVDKLGGFFRPISKGVADGNITVKPVNYQFPNN